jgi:imidazolonepropionase-like amidohydrolase
MKTCRYALFSMLFPILTVPTVYAADKAPSQDSKREAPIAIVGGKLLTVSHGVVDNGVLILADGKIAAVGNAKDVSIPKGAIVVDAKGMTVYPGLIDSETNLGLVEVGSDKNTKDLVEPTDEITPQMHVYDAFHAETTHIPIARRNGITNAIVAPGQQNSLPGQDSFIQLFGRDRDDYLQVLDAALAVNFGAEQRRVGAGLEAPDGRGPKYPSTRMGLMTQLRQAFLDAQEYDRKKQDSKNRGTAFKTSLLNEALLPYLHGEKPVVLGVVDAQDVAPAMSFVQEFHLKVILNRLTHAQGVIDKIASYKVPVIFGPIWDLPQADERYDAVYSMPAELAKRGVKVAIATYNMQNDRNLPYAAGYAVTYGMPYEEALRSITLTPAELFGVSDKLGSLDVGKLANVVIANGDPLDVRTDVKQVYINGVAVPMTSRQTELRDAYSK